MTGHIAMGAPGELREYMLMETDLYTKSPANQFAAKLATGAGDYDDLQNWSYLVMDDWRAGLGKKDVTGGGFLWSTLETRYPMQMMLPRHLRLEMNDNGSFAGVDGRIISGERTIGTAQTFRRWAMQITGGSLRVVNEIWLYLKNDGAAYTVAVFSDSGGSPNAALASTSVTADNPTPGYAWYKCGTISQATTGSVYWLVIYPTSGTGIVPVVDSTVGGPTAKYYDGSAWAATTNLFGAILNPEAYDNAAVGGVPRDNVVVAEFDGDLYASCSTSEKIFKRQVSAPGWAMSASSIEVTSIFPLGGYLYVANDVPAGVPANIDDTFTVTYFAVPGSISGTGEVAHYAMWAGYLWAAYGNYVWYTATPAADDVQWVGPIVAAHEGVTITAIAGQGDYLWVATDVDLCFVGPGDQVIGANAWGSPSANNGRGMIGYQGSLFIPMQESLIRFDGNAMLPIGPDLDEGMPADLQGNIVALTSTNNWFIAAVDPRDGTSAGGTILAWDNTGWHYLAGLPPGMRAKSLYYRRSDQRLYIGCVGGHVFSLYLPDVVQTVETTEPEFGPSGWMETDWFYGGLREINKDVHSLYVLGEDISTNRYIDVYWQDDASAGEWQLLGRVTENLTELVWSDYATRPDTKRIKLGFNLHTNTPGTSPIITAIRVKYHPMVQDWFRWSFPVTCSDGAQEFGSAASPYSAQQKRDHLDGLITQVHPFIFRDMDGKEYEVKVMGCQIQNTDVQWINDRFHMNTIYSMTIEAIQPGVYDG